MHTQVYIGTHKPTHTYTGTQMHTHEHMYTRMYTRARVHTRVHTYTSAHGCSKVHTSARTYTQFGSHPSHAPPGPSCPPRPTTLSRPTKSLPGSPLGDSDNRRHSPRESGVGSTLRSTDGTVPTCHHRGRAGRKKPSHQLLSWTHLPQSSSGLGGSPGLKGEAIATPPAPPAHAPAVTHAGRGRGRGQRTNAPQSPGDGGRTRTNCLTARGSRRNRRRTAWTEATLTAPSAWPHCPSVV